MASKSNETPMQKQYSEIKKAYEGFILFFRMGEFYEMFDEDAVVGSKILGIALTKRNKNSEQKMCGIPVRSYQQYLIKLLKAGEKVAICEQIEDPREAKGLVKRAVTRVVTPATVIEEEAIESFDNNFLLSVFKDTLFLYCIAADVSTGELFFQKVPVNLGKQTINKWSVKEAIANEDISSFTDTPLEIVKNNSVYKVATERFCQHFNIKNPIAYGVQDKQFLYAFAQIIEYLENLMISIDFQKPKIINSSDNLIIDNTAMRTLELLYGLRSGSTKNSLINILNKCQTAMGSRLLKNNIFLPSREIEVINRRLDTVDYFYKNRDERENIYALLEQIHDIERIVGRLISGRATPRDLIWLKISLLPIPYIAEALKQSSNKEVKNLLKNIGFVEELIDIIDKSINDTPPITITDGGIIKEGYNQEIDSIRKIKDNSTALMEEIENREREATGINNLRIKYNGVLGFYIEVSKGNLSKVPYEYVRRQTLVNAERFTTPELKDLEEKVVSADENLKTLEYELFCDIRNQCAEMGGQLRELSQEIAYLDYVISMAVIAIKNGYIKPILNTDGKLEVTNGRHPVVEEVLSGSFVPNDIHMNSENSRVLLITGPNMSGKSTYIRQVALIAIMAHMGSFVPADYALVPIFDRVFTRIGASDDLSQGESTFMVEMLESANILNNATKNSLIVLDEIGRGTSTYDGLSIAYSITHYLLNFVGAKTLFATHYHEMTNLADSYKGIKNMTVDVIEEDNNVIFLRKLIDGFADKSYGIHVAKMAGMPEVVIDKANEILDELENNKSQANSDNLVGHGDIQKYKVSQPILFVDDNPLTDRLKEVDINNITPLEALNILKTMKESFLEDS